MTRRAPSALFGIFLLLCQILQGGMAAAMPCAGDLNDFVVCGTAREDCAGADHFRTVDAHTNPQSTHCRFCNSGACRMTHAPALSIALPPMLGFLPRSMEAPQPKVEHFTAPFEKILRPPK
jgi:hypothetical protein